MMPAASQISQVEAPSHVNNGGIWLQVLSHLNPQYGGIALSVPQAARVAESFGVCQCPIAGFCEAGELQHLAPAQRLTAHAFSPSRMRSMVDPGLRRQLSGLISKANGVHIHGIWESYCSTAAGIAWASKRPYLVSAHGMLDPWALRHKRLRKLFYAWLIETRTLQRASCLRALTLDEVADYRRLGLDNPIAVIPNGFEAQTGVTADLFWQQYAQLTGKRIVLFLGRLNPKKGLHLLLQAWGRLKGAASDAHLVIAGPNSEGTRGTLEKLTGDLDLRSSVTFAGMAGGEKKWSMLAAAELFVLPSFSEGFSVAVLEALAMGVPALITPACHFPEVAAHRCGWIVQTEVAALEAGLRDYLSLSAEEAAQWGKRGRELVERRFRWPVVGKQLSEVYQWLQGGSKPSGVEFA